MKPIAIESGVGCLAWVAPRRSREGIAVSFGHHSQGATPDSAECVKIRTIARPPNGDRHYYCLCILLSFDRYAIPDTLERRAVRQPGPVQISTHITLLR
jgi:hypothetical protein